MEIIFQNFTAENIRIGGQQIYLKHLSHTWHVFEENKNKKAKTIILLMKRQTDSNPL